MRKDIVVGFCTLVMCGLLPVPPVRAELAYQQKQIELQADARSTVLETKFHFTNVGKTAVDIGNVESSCGCTTAALDKRHFEPGQSGDIVARYTVGNHVGTQTLTIAVPESGRDRPTMLSLVVKVPEILRITPAFVYWTHDEEPKTKRITLELLPETAISDITAQSLNGGMKLALVTLVKGHKYALDLTPLRTSELIVSDIPIHCVYGHEEKDFHAFATVRAAMPDR